MKKQNEETKLKKQLFDKIEFVCEDKELKKKLEEAFLKKLLSKEVEK